MTNRMIKKNFTKLVTQSYSDEGYLDAKTVDQITEHMNRKTLKEYLRVLKQEEKKRQVIVNSPTPLSQADREKMQAQFPTKKIIYMIDPEMISGVQVVNNDEEFEISLNQTFDDIINHLSKYD